MYTMQNCYIIKTIIQQCTRLFTSHSIHISKATSKGIEHSHLLFGFAFGRQCFPINRVEPYTNLFESDLIFMECWLAWMPPTVLIKCGFLIYSHYIRIAFTKKPSTQTAPMHKRIWDLLLKYKYKYRHHFEWAIVISGSFKFWNAIESKHVWQAHNSLDSFEQIMNI